MVPHPSRFCLKDGKLRHTFQLFAHYTKAAPCMVLAGSNRLSVRRSDAARSTAVCRIHCRHGCAAQAS